jgi:hypothetical protein
MQYTVIKGDPEDLNVKKNTKNIIDFQEVYKKRQKNINPVASAPGFLFAKVFLENADRIYLENHQTKETISRS